MATVNFYLDIRRAKKDGSYPIKLHVRHNGKFLIGTEFTSIPETWTGSGYTKNERNYKAKNAAIHSLLNKVEIFLITLDTSGKLKSTSDKTLKEQIEKLLKNNSVSDKRFIDYIGEFVLTKNKKNTIDCYVSTKNKLLSYDENCSFDTMDKKMARIIR